ncbi:MAG: glycoside hydrolase family 57 protein [bacterium]|nr:glycoside hydrolase family 57 protein [bacterium]
MTNQPLHVALLWHMHQPYYKNDLTGKYSLPWVRLHCTKDYYDMAAILDEFPQIHQTFNLVPSLLVQIEDYVKNNASDEFLDKTIIPADKLTEEDKNYILANFFMANWSTMVYSFARYAELLDKRGRYTSVQELNRIKRYFKTQDYLDLQVLFNLVWIDPFWRKRDQKLQQIIDKGKNFTEEEKLFVVQKHRDIMAQVIGKYKEMQDRGQIEVTTTPFYHPILPLLCNTDSARIATPEIILPKKGFRHPEDARIQIQRAVEYYEKCFGRKPRGMWPSEGSVSEDIIPLVAEAGIKWIATDQDILANTLKIVLRKDFNSNDVYSDALYKGYRAKNQDKEVNIVFRDKALSDLIGFTYSHMSTRDAINNFIGTLRHIRDNVNKMPGPHLLSIILDGENAWEFYPDDGEHFLRALYRELSADPGFRTVTFSEYLEQYPPQYNLFNLFAGSWINHNFGVWIGHYEDNTAWDYLERTRDILVRFTQGHPQGEFKSAIAKAWEEIYIAEGSDWCWWYGDDHSSANDEEFDLLFRLHLMNVYKLINEKVPDWLYVAIKGIAKSKPTQYPLSLISPIIDGKVTNYYEWQNAGFYDVSKTGGTMYRANTIVNLIYYGFDLKNMYLRLDLNTIFNSSETDNLILEFNILEPKPYTVVLNLSSSSPKVLAISEVHDSSNTKVGDLTTVSIDKFIELSIPFSLLNLKADDLVSLNVLVKRNSFEIERWPARGLISFKVPGEDFILDFWEV